MQQVRDNIERIRQVWSNDSKIELAKPKQRDVEICRKQSKHGSKHDQSIGNQGVCPPQDSMSKADSGNDNEQRPRRHNDYNNDDCTVWRSCVAGNPPSLGKVEGQVPGSQSLLPYDGLLEQEYLNLPLSQIGGACI